MKLRHTGSCKGYLKELAGGLKWRKWHVNTGINQASLKRSISSPGDGWAVSMLNLNRLLFYQSGVTAFAKLNICLTAFSYMKTALPENLIKG